MVTADAYESIRQAHIEDVGGIIELISPLEQDGTLVRRSREQLELEINRFHVVERDGAIIACAALYPYPDENCGELACLAVHPEYQKEGWGNILLDRMTSIAKEMRLSSLFVLTTRTLHWFRERGFSTQDINSLPVKKRELYNYQRNSKVLAKNL
jgi:amino-acid N-acetyltransferase